jgi:sec-independent protein translocase protein TatC
MVLAQEQARALPPAADDPEHDDHKMTIQEHLEELRDRLIKSVVALVVCTIPGLFLAQPIWNNVLRPLLAPEYPLVFDTVMGAFMTWLYIGLTVGFGLSTPIVFYQLASFIAPALTRQEKRFILMSLPAVFICFVGGVAFAYFVVLPSAVTFMVGWAKHIGLEGIAELIKVENFVEFVLQIGLWTGVAFETPVIVVTLKKIGILNEARIKAVRRYFIVIAFVIAAFITPTPDALTQIMIAVPIILLYELGALISKVV